MLRRSQTWSRVARRTRRCPFRTDLVSLRTLSPDPISEVVATPPIAAAGVLQAEDSGSPAASQLFPAFFPPPSLSSPAGPPPARAVAKWQKTFSTVVVVLAPVHKSTQATESIVHDPCRRKNSNKHGQLSKFNPREDSHPNRR